MNLLRAFLVGCMIAPVAPALGNPPESAKPEKVILDTDFNEFGDDGQVLFQAARAHHDGKIRLLGVTLVAGNAWVEQQEVLATRAVERLGLEEAVSVYSGAHAPLLHSFASFEQEKALLGVGDGYWGAWSKPRPRSPADVKLPFDGRAVGEKIQDEHAVDFIIDAVRANPHEVTILAIGPLTNIAMAIRKAPDIAPLIGRIVYMAGAFDVPGNTMPAAEFNVWFDPEAAKIVFREPIEHIIFPLDVTNTVRLKPGVFEQISKANPVAAGLYRSSFDAPTDPTRGGEIQFWDQVAMAYIADPSLVTEVEERWIDVDDSMGPNYGRTMSYRHVHPQNRYLQKAKIVKKMDVVRFEDYFIKALSAPLPKTSR